jgi:ethanolamine utilization protein EutN
VAVDIVGAGMGETVLVAEGSSARLALDISDIPIDAAVVGIVDTMEVQGQ